MSKPPFLLYEADETPGKWFYLLAAIMLLAILGFMGRMDYLEAASQECAAKHMQYDPENDICFTEHRNPHNAKDPRNGPPAQSN